VKLLIVTVTQIGDQGEHGLEIISPKGTNLQSVSCHRDVNK
jgi:hypothetical protein